jgi:hypothetical protein
VRKTKREGIISKARVTYIPSLGHYRVCCAPSKERKGMGNGSRIEAKHGATQVVLKEHSPVAQQLSRIIAKQAKITRGRRKVKGGE